MELKKFLADAGYHPDTIAEADALVAAVHTATTAFGYEIGSAGSSEGGMLGKTIRAVIGAYQNSLDTGQKRRFIKLLHSTYSQQNPVFNHSTLPGLL